MTIKNIMLEIEGTPRAKGRPRFGKSGTYTPKATVVAEGKIKSAAVGVDKMSGPLRVSISFFFPVSQSWTAQKKDDAINGRIFPTGKPDLDNLVKLVLDALNGVAYADDAAIVSITARKSYSPIGGKTRIVISQEQIK